MYFECKDNINLLNLNVIFTVVYKLRDNFKNFNKYSEILKNKGDPFFEFDDFFKL